MSSAITMQAPCSLVNCGLKEKPSASKKARERFMSLIGRLTKILRPMADPSADVDLVEPVLGLGLHDAREVLQFIQLAHLDVAGDALADRIGEALGPLDRLVARAGLDQRVAGDQFLALGEGPVDDGALAAVVLHAPALAARLQARGIEQRAGAGELLVEARHRLEQRLGVGREAARF